MVILLFVNICGKMLFVIMFGERDFSVFGYVGVGKMLLDVWVWDIGYVVWFKVEIVGDCFEL